MLVEKPGLEFTGILKLLQQETINTSPFSAPQTEILTSGTPVNDSKSDPRSPMSQNIFGKGVAATLLPLRIPPACLGDLSRTWIALLSSALLNAVLGMKLSNILDMDQEFTGDQL